MSRTISPDPALATYQRLVRTAIIAAMAAIVTTAAGEQAWIGPHDEHRGRRGPGHVYQVKQVAQR